MIWGCHYFWKHPHLLDGFFRLPSLAQQEKKDEAIQQAKAIADQEMDKVTLGSGCIPRNYG